MGLHDSALDSGGGDEVEAMVVEEESPAILGERIPFGAVVAIAHTNDNPPYTYELLPNMLPPLDYAHFSNKINIDHLL